MSLLLRGIADRGVDAFVFLLLRRQGRFSSVCQILISLFLVEVFSSEQYI